LAKANLGSQVTGSDEFIFCPSKYYSLQAVQDTVTRSKKLYLRENPFGYC